VKFLALPIFMVLFAGSAGGQPPRALFEDSLSQLGSGYFRQAEEGLRTCLQGSAESSWSPVEEAAALKWLAQALAAQGRDKYVEAVEHLKKAQELLVGLNKESFPGAAAEQGRIFLVEAQLLCLDAVRELRQLRLAGVEEKKLFEFLQKCIAPASEALDQAKKLYPPDLLADVYLAEADLANLTLSLNRLFLQKRDLTDSYQKLRERYQAAVEIEKQRGQEVRSDVLASAWIGIGTAFREEAGLKPNGDRIYQLEQAIEAFSNALETDTPHSELILTATIGKARSLLDACLDTPMPEELANRLETMLLSAADAFEVMRAHQAGGGLLQDASSFFSSRTIACETLLILYEKTNQPEKMLLAVERMKARSFRDILRAEEVKLDGFDSSLDIQKIAEQLKNQNAGLVEFFYGPEQAWVFWVPPDGRVAVRKLGMTGQELTQKISMVMAGFSDPMVLRLHVRRLRRGTHHPAVAKAYVAANELYHELLEPVEAKMQAGGLDMLYIVPHHSMHYLPFQALVVNRNEEDLFLSEFYIQKGRALAYLPSCATLQDLGGELPAGNALVFARSDFTGQRPFYPSDLPNAVPEAKMAAAALGVVPFLENEATEEKVWSVRDPCSVLYFATHGDLKSERPLDSSLLLAETAGQEGSHYDGFLTVREILGELRGKLKSELVVMSACFTNRGEPNPLSGDDLSNLSRAFLIAGARSVLATQWAASDDTFPVIMSFFLDGLISSDNPKTGKALALNEAVQKFLAQENLGVYRHPLFWAPVVLLGDGYSGISLKHLAKENF